MSWQKEKQKSQSGKDSLFGPEIHDQLKCSPLYAARNPQIWEQLHYKQRIKSLTGNLPGYDESKAFSLPSAAHKLCKCGYLERQSMHLGRWKKRYYLLRGRVLLYYRTEPNTETLGYPKGIIFLASSRLRCVSRAFKAFCFEIEAASPEFPSYTLACPTEYVRKQWLDAIDASINAPLRTLQPFNTISADPSTGKDNRNSDLGGYLSDTGAVSGARPRDSNLSAYGGGGGDRNGRESNLSTLGTSMRDSNLSAYGGGGRPDRNDEVSANRGANDRPGLMHSKSMASGGGGSERAGRRRSQDNNLLPSSSLSSSYSNTSNLLSRLRESQSVATPHASTLNPAGAREAAKLVAASAKQVWMIHTYS